MEYKEHMPVETIEQDPKIVEFVKRNIYEADSNPSGPSRCVDGRYEGNLPALAQPGADAGSLLEILGALKTLHVPLSKPLRLDVINSVVEVLGGSDQFAFHTDEHAEHDHKGLAQGCGHMRLVKENPDNYALDKDNVDSVFSSLEALKRNGSEEVILHGDHKEKAVFVVEEPTWGLRPWDPDNDMQAFVWHEALSKKRWELLAEHIAPIIQKDSKELLEAIEKVAAIQRSETLKHLAEGKSIYTVEKNKDGTPLVKFFGTV